MPRKTKCPILGELRKATVDEQRATEFMEAERWGDSPVCPRCDDNDVYQMMTKDGERNPNFRWRCRGCKKMYSVRTGTVMEESRLSLRVWVYAFWKACSSKKGISALQLSREMEITHKSALYVLRRIRYGLGDGQGAPKLKGTVEADETYVGGKPRYKGQSKRGRGTKKTPVFGMAARGGDVRFKVMERVTAAELGKALSEQVDPESRLITDEFASYEKPGKGFKGGHETVNHSEGEYVKPGTDVHTNGIEGVFSLLKRGVMGTFHSISKKHLGNYLDEFAFRYNTRYVDDGQRVRRAIRRVDGKRLPYRQSVDSPPWLA